MGEDWFSTHSVTAALHIRAEQVQKWIDQGRLKCRRVHSGGLTRQIIVADDFCAFCKEHRHEIVGYRQRR
jgi:hypothetical protein